MTRTNTPVPTPYVVSPLSLPVTINEIAERLELSVSSLHRRARFAGREHEPRQIWLGEKPRLLRVPRPSLMALQRRLHRRVLQQLPVHNAVHSRAFRSVITNATAHIGHLYVSLRDIEKCFPSVRSPMVSAALESAGFDADAAALVRQLCTSANELPQGAPTSPALLNFVLAPIDAQVGALAERRKLTYTRYADDLALSGDVSLADILLDVEDIVESQGFRINSGKRRDWGPAAQAKVTGIVLAGTLQPDPEFLTDLTNELLQVANGNWQCSVEELQGKISWVSALDRRLGDSLRQRLEGAIRRRPRRRKP